MSSTTLELSDVANKLRDRLGDDLIDTQTIELAGGQMIVRVAADRRPDALRVLKNLGLEFYGFCAGVDWPDDDRMEVLDQVYDHRQGLRVTVKADVPRSAPRIPTAVNVYAGADWHERETWEMYGIVFAGHPRLRRLLLPDWFEGFPMRKDYELPARIEKPWPGDSFEG